MTEWLTEDGSGLAQTEGFSWLALLPDSQHHPGFATYHQHHPTEVDSLRPPEPGPPICPRLSTGTAAEGHVTSHAKRVRQPSPDMRAPAEPAAGLNSGGVSFPAPDLAFPAPDEPGVESTIVLNNAVVARGIRGPSRCPHCGNHAHKTGEAVQLPRAPVGAQAGDEPKARYKVRARQRKQNMLGNWNYKHGYRGALYCKSCSESFRSHLFIGRHEKSRSKCTRSEPCKHCSKVSRLLQLLCLTAGLCFKLTVWRRCLTWPQILKEFNCPPAELFRQWGASPILSLY
jgi:hypothetical protein